MKKIICRFIGHKEFRESGYRCCLRCHAHEYYDEDFDKAVYLRYFVRLLNLISEYRDNKRSAKSSLEHEQDWYGYLADCNLRDIKQHLLYPINWIKWKFKPIKQTDENELPF
jgi:hypothetical protein